MSLGTTDDLTADAFFGPPYVDVDEWRDSPQRHRYVHGGFEGTDTRFSIYFPPAEAYGGRFIHMLEGSLGGNESTAVHGQMFGGIKLAFGFDAYLIECNQGHTGDMAGIKDDGTILNYRANAQAARFARQLATEMYGARPHHGYVFGGSGGGHRSLMALENTDGIYDGAVPFMIPPPIPANSANAARVLRRKLDGIVDAMEPGGSGNPFAGLTTAEREALAALYQAGYPRHTEFMLTPQPIHLMLMNRMRMVDPTYFDEFWTVPGYLGADDPHALAADLIEEKNTVGRVLTVADVQATGAPGLRSFPYLGMLAPDTAIGITLQGETSRDILPGTTLTVASGKAAGRQLYASGTAGEVIISMIGPSDWTFGRSAPFQDVEPGDEVHLSNRDILAFCHYDRYQYRPEIPFLHQPQLDGLGIYPTRPHVDLGHKFQQPPHTGRFAGKMILLQHLYDAACWPVSAIFYEHLVREQLGDEIDDRFRLWFIDHAHHMPPSTVVPAVGPAASTRLIDYMGCVEQAIGHLIDWVEDGTPPPASSGYECSDGHGVTLASSAAARHSIQPVITVTVDGGEATAVASGETVRFDVHVEVPADAGSLIGAEWDFGGNGAFDVAVDGLDGKTDATFTTEHRFTEAGCYLPSLRVRSRRDRWAGAGLPVANLGRVRVVVR